MIRQIVAFGAGIVLILVGAWVMAIKTAVMDFDSTAFYE